MQLPGPVRAVVGLLATAADEAKHLPDRAVELPMLAVSSALQMSLRAQQRYARLAARGDDVINRRPVSDEPPAWATFDDPVSPDELSSTTLDDPDAAQRARAAGQLLDQLLGMGEQAASESANGTGSSAPDTGDPSDGTDADVVDFPTPAARQRATTSSAAKPPPAAKRTAAKRAPAAAPAAKKATKNPPVAAPADKQATPGTKVIAKKSSATDAAPEKGRAPAKEQAPPVPKAATKKVVPAATGRAAKSTGKTINKPRHGTPSAFDTVDDD
jgi:hypothetical protein